MHSRDIVMVVAACWCAVGVGLDFPKEWFHLTNMLCTLLVLLLLLLMQHSQIRDMQALHAKAGELIRSTEGRYNQMIGAGRCETHESEQMVRDRQADA